MPDITKCQGNGCPKRERCWRAVAPSSGLTQSWFVELPPDDGKGSCKHFWPTVQFSQVSDPNDFSPGATIPSGNSQ